MRISELSERSGVPAATIKYYVREGVLPEGERHGYNRTDYDEHHLVRLRLVRALLEVGGLGIQTIAAVIAAIDDPELPMPEVMQKAQGAIPHGVSTTSAASRDRVMAAMDELGWLVEPDNVGVALAAEALDAFERLGRGDLAASLPVYLQAAELMATADLQRVAAVTGRDRIVETVIVGTILGDRLIAGLHRAAQQSLARQHTKAQNREQTATTNTPGGRS